MTNEMLARVQWLLFAAHASGYQTCEQVARLERIEAYLLRRWLR